ncbi:MAG: hypothetical protein L6262_00430 [Weeksellaceae bacterium]|nr:hypothetical protein [Weeksellaceae bacterium]
MHSHTKDEMSSVTIIQSTLGMADFDAAFLMLKMQRVKEKAELILTNRKTNHQTNKSLYDEVYPISPISHFVGKLQFHGRRNPNCAIGLYVFPFQHQFYLGNPVDRELRMESKRSATTEGLSE